MGYLEKHFFVLAEKWIEIIDDSSMLLKVMKATTVLEELTRYFTDILSRDSVEIKKTTKNRLTDFRSSLFGGESTTKV